MDTYLIAEELGRDREMTDQEYYQFVLEEWDKLSPERIAQLRQLFEQEPWKSSRVESLEILLPSKKEELGALKDDLESLQWITGIIERGEIARISSAKQPLPATQIPKEIRRIISACHSSLDFWLNEHEASLNHLKQIARGRLKGHLENLAEVFVNEECLKLGLPVLKRSASGPPGDLGTLLLMLEEQYHLPMNTFGEVRGIIDASVQEVARLAQ